ncbi:MAG TPA: carboxypeptidase-like regulatory domain-containing protein, partial [Anaerolineales bacterium]|nr:carboxypeptidase-like regulatory domain-containing protein [Anaerolineales bacterium]
PPDTGIEGQVLIGPMCPVVQSGTPCPDQPYQATIAVLDKNGRQVAQFQSDAQGWFLVSLAPGAYVLHPESPDGFARAGEQPVTVVSGQYTQVTITYDSGIR